MQRDLATLNNVKQHKSCQLVQKFQKFQKFECVIISQFFQICSYLKGRFVSNCAGVAGNKQETPTLKLEGSDNCLKC